MNVWISGGKQEEGGGAAGVLLSIIPFVFVSIKVYSIESQKSVRVFLGRKEDDDKKQSDREAAA